MEKPRSTTDGPEDTESRLRPANLEDVTVSGAVRSAEGGRIVGSYRIIRKLGEGGMGVVYEAEQQNPRRAVALKLIRGTHLDPDQVRRFEREAQTLARLKHPGIAAIYESGQTADGEHYIAMELVRGETLRDYMKRVRQSAARDHLLREWLYLFLKICNAVGYAHQRAVIHRDLKPSNVLVVRQSDTPSGPPGSSHDVKVLDFGLARITGSDLSTVVTQIGKIQGTLPYMSPEQVRGDPDEVDLRTDVYALGVILYEIVVGALPYDISRVGVHEAARIICEESPRPITSSWSGSRLDPDLKTIVSKALEKEPQRRYQSVAALGEDVERSLSNQPILARRASAAYQMRKLIARHKIPFALIVALALLVVVSAITMSVLYGRQRQARIRADAALERNEAMNRALRKVQTSLAPDPTEPPAVARQEARASSGAATSSGATTGGPGAIDPRAMPGAARSKGRSDVQNSQEPNRATSESRGGSSTKSVDPIVAKQRAAADWAIRSTLASASLSMIVREHEKAEKQLLDCYEQVKLGEFSQEIELEVLEQLRTVYTEMGKPDEARRFRILGDQLVAAGK